MITEKDILKTGLNKAIKNTWIWSNDFYTEHINPKYGYFLYATLHVPTDIWRNSERAGLEDNFCRVILHRYYDIKDPHSNWDRAREEGESIEVYRGVIRDSGHLVQLLKDTGVKE